MTGGSDENADGDTKARDVELCCDEELVGRYVGIEVLKKTKVP